MAVTPRTRTIIWAKSGSRCAFPNCRKELVVEATAYDREVLVGEIAHIVAQSRDGPRGDNEPVGGDVDGHGNLILFCPEHHTIIDTQVATYSVPRLEQFKSDHEKWVRESLSTLDRYRHIHEPEEYLREELTSTLLIVESMPEYIFGAPCTVDEPAVKELLKSPENSSWMLPYIVRENHLYTFYSLKSDPTPFEDAIDVDDIKPIPQNQWLKNDDKRRWFVTLLNRSLNKLTGRKSLHLDKDHSRYFFPPEEDGTPRTVRYKTLGNRKSSRSVAYLPRRRATGETKKYWEHYAASLSFVQCGEKSWCLSIRPERRFTRDGKTPIAPKGTGKKANKKKSRMYNIDFWEEVHFWRDYLCDGKPRIIFDFGRQQIVVNSKFLSPSIEWPAIPDDVAKEIKIEYRDDLFSSAEYSNLLGLEEDEVEDWDENQDG